MERSPGAGRYAHPEREQRWLLDALPDGVVSEVTIIDRYVIGTTLRLRQMIDSAGGAIHKLGQKVRLRSDDPERVQLTNLYLRADEYELLAGLPAAELHKTRWHLSADHPYVVDVFAGPLAGLILAELELGDDEPPVARPPWALVEVTGDDRYSGGRLAALVEGEVGPLLVC